MEISILGQINISQSGNANGSMCVVNSRISPLLMYLLKNIFH